MCYKNCKSCNYYGNEEENNCTSCINNYFFLPENNTKNCFPKCSFYYYFSQYNIYSCTPNYQCPEEAKLLIRNKSKCIDNCSKDNIYKYQYSGECYEKCPDDTNENEYKCEIKNTNSCSLSIYPLKVLYNELNENNIDSFTKNYVEEFNYTNNQIVNYSNTDYSLIIYKNSLCIKELSLAIPIIDFGDCYEKIKLTYNISEDLVFAILEKNIENRNPITSYLLFNPINGEKLNASEICKNEKIIMRENVLMHPGINSSLIFFFAAQDINVFNISDQFYTDICKCYESPNERDIPLKLRLQIFFPNISFCDEGCINKGVDIKTMESICYCLFKEFSDNSIISNIFEYNDILGGFYKFISNSNIDVLFCIKDIFQWNNFKRCTGGFIIIALLVFQIICVLIYFHKSQYDFKRYIYKLLNSYLENLKTQLNNIKSEPPKKKKKKKRKKEFHLI